MIESLGPTAFLQRFEELWAPRLRGRSLVGEAFMDRDPTQQPLMALRALGRVYLRSHQPYNELARRPASLLVAMTWLGAERYDVGGFWPRLWEEVGRSPGAEEQGLWGGAYLEALRSQGLPVFDVGQIYVGNVLMHAGLPTSELEDFFRLLERARQCAGSDPAAVTRWVREQVMRGTGQLSKAAGRFLVDGEEVAEDLVHRSLDLLEQLDRDEEPAVALGDRFVTAARQRHVDDRRRVVPQPRHGSTATGQSDRPALRLDTSTGQLAVELPFVPDAAPNFSWQIIADGRADVLRPRTSRGGARTGAVAARWDVPRPVTSLAVSARGLAALRIPVVDPGAPVLLFGSEGHQISAGASLPRDDVWVLRPSSLSTSQGSARCVAELDAPAGWSGWLLELLDVSQASEVAWGSQRVAVRGLHRARVVTETPVVGVFSHGLPVLPRRPTVELPQGGRPEDWTITVVDAETKKLYSVARGPGDLFPEVRGPVMGRFDIVVRGPLARGRQVRVAIAESLSVDYSPACRIIRPDGLSTATASLSSTGGGGLAMPAVIQFGPADQALSTTASAGGDSLDLEIKPPAMSACLVRGSTAGPYLYGPVDALTEELGDAELLLRLPDEAPRRLALVVGRGTPHRQALEATRHQSGPLRFPLARAADAAQRLGAGEMVFEGVGDPVTLLRFRPRRLAEAVVLGRRGLRVVGAAAATAGLEAIVWAVYAPWLGCRVASVDGEGELDVPEDFQGQGPLAVLIRVVDDWNPQPPPVSPMGLDVLHVDLATAPTTSALTRWLAQAAPSLRQHDVLQLVAVLAMLSALGEEGGRLFPAWVVQHVVDVLAGAGHQLFEALRQVVPDVEVQARLLVHSGLASRAFGEWTDGAIVTRLSSPLLGALSVSRRALVEEKCRSAVADSLGDAFIAVARGSADPAAAAGRFDSSVERLATSDHWDAVRRLANLVPQRFLDVDARASAALDLCERRGAPRLLATTRSAQRLVLSARWALKQSGLRDAVDAIDARRERERTDGWLSLSAMSLALALLARFAASGYDGGIVDALRAGTPHWRAVVDVAPGLVARDLALAQAFVLRQEATGSPAYPVHVTRGTW